MNELLTQLKDETNKKIEAIKETYNLAITKYKAKIKNNEKDIEAMMSSIRDCETDIGLCETQMTNVNLELDNYIEMTKAVNQYGVFDRKEKENEFTEGIKKRKEEIEVESKTKITELNVTIENFNADIKGLTSESENLKEVIKELETKLGSVVTDLENEFKVNFEDFNKLNKEYIKILEKADGVLKQVSKLEQSVPDLEIEAAKEEPLLTESGKLPVSDKDLSPFSEEAATLVDPILTESGKLPVSDKDLSPFSEETTLSLDPTLTESGKLPVNNQEEKTEEIRDPNEHLEAGKVDTELEDVDTNTFVDLSLYVDSEEGLTFGPFSDIDNIKDGSIEYSPFAEPDEEKTEEKVEKKELVSLDQYLGIHSTGFDEQQKEFIALSMTPERYTQVVNILNNYGIDLSNLEEANSFIVELVNAEPTQLDEVLGLLRSVGKNNEQLDFFLNLDMILSTNPELVRYNIQRIIRDQKDPKDINIIGLAFSPEHGQKVKELLDLGYDYNALEKAFPELIYRLNVQELLEEITRKEGLQAATKMEATASTGMGRS